MMNLQPGTSLQGGKYRIEHFISSGGFGCTYKATHTMLEDTVARANWGSTWCMPTLDEIKELVNKCTWNWTTLDGHNGYRVTGPNGKSIFLPAAGSCTGTSLLYAGSSGYYWSATSDDKGTHAYGLGIDSSNHDWSSRYRYDGRVVRPVTD